MALRYLFDEHLRGVLPETVMRRAKSEGYEIDIVEVGDEQDLPLGISDRQMLLWAEEHDRIVVSHDAKTLPGHLAAHLAAGRQSPGVFIVRLPIDVVLADWLVVIAIASDPAEWRNRLEFVP